MTYVLATVRQGVSAILADSRITSQSPSDSHDDMTKVGILFPGCIFGVAGSTAGLNPFLSNFQGSAGIVGYDPIANWEYFKTYAAGYVTKDEFQVVLSERTSGTPRLHLYDSTLRKLSPCGEFVTLGSGKQFFDLTIGDWIDTKLGAVEERLISLYGNTLLFPNFICLVLIEIVQGEDAAFFRSQEIGIGGVFHYVVQNPACEKFQVPSVYLVLRRDAVKESHVVIAPFRVCGTEFGLTIQGAPPFDVRPSLHLDMSKRDVRNWSQEGMNRFIDRVLVEINKLPKYNFLGICFAEKKYRGSVIVDTTFSEDYRWNGGNKIDPTLWRQIEEIYGAVDSVQPTGSGRA